MEKLTKLIEKLNKINFKKGYEFIREEEASYKNENFLVGTISGVFLVKKKYSTTKFEKLTNCVESKEDNCIEIKNDYYFELNFSENKKNFYLKNKNVLIIINLTKLDNITMINVKTYKKGVDLE